MASPIERFVSDQVDNALDDLVTAVFEKGEGAGHDSVELGKALLAATWRFEDAISDTMIEDGWLAFSNGEWIEVPQ